MPIGHQLQHVSPAPRGEVVTYREVFLFKELLVEKLSLPYVREDVCGCVQ